MIEGHEVGIGRAVGQYYASCTHDATTTLRHTVYVTCKNLISIPISPLGLAECIGNMINHIMLSLEGSRGNITVAVVTKLRFQKKTRFLYLQVLPHFCSGARLTRKSDVNRKEEDGVKVRRAPGRHCIRYGHYTKRTIHQIFAIPELSLSASFTQTSRLDICNGPHPASI
jgi:hypothetical protein